MLMPFGKYAGHEIGELPDDYLLWLLENVELRDPLLSAIEEEVVERGRELPPLPSPQLPKKPRKREEEGIWTKGGNPQDYIKGDFPISSRKR